MNASEVHKNYIIHKNLNIAASVAETIQYLARKHESRHHNAEMLQLLDTGDLVQKLDRLKTFDFNLVKKKFRVSVQMCYVQCLISFRGVGIQHTDKYLLV